MYIVGELRIAIKADMAAWDYIAIRLTARGAAKACTSPKHFYFKTGRNGQVGEKVWPRR